MILVNNDEKYIDTSEINEKNIDVLSKDRIQILKLLSKQSMYPAQIARKLNVEIQSIYYHINLLEKSNLISFSGYEHIGGTAAKKYVLNFDAISLIFKDNWKPFTAKVSKVPKFLEFFLSSGYFNGKIIVGSPDPHGKYRARGSEFAIMELTMFMGRYTTFSPPLYLLDTEVTQEDKKSNLLLAGGPKVNVIVNEINQNLPVRFQKDSFDIYSTISKKTYGENVGIIELIQNPFSKNNKILLIGGLNYHGTRSAVLALLKTPDILEQGNSYNPKIMAKVVEGYDQKGSGIIDTVEILE